MNVVIIDSGVGGKMIFNNLTNRYPLINFKLIEDAEYFPYGNKTKSQLNNRFKSIIKKECYDLLIIGCNTLSILLDYNNINSNVINMVSITNDYLLKKKYNNILLLGTTNTISNNPYNTTFSIVVDDLIRGIQYNDYTDLLKELFDNLKDNYDAIILGCTHLIKVKEEFRNRFKCDIISQDELIFL